MTPLDLFWPPPLMFFGNVSKNYLIFWNFWYHSQINCPVSYYIIRTSIFFFKSWKLWSYGRINNRWFWTFFFNFFQLFFFHIILKHFFFQNIQSPIFNKKWPKTFRQDPLKGRVSGLNNLLTFSQKLTTFHIFWVDPPT